MCPNCTCIRCLKFKSADRLIKQQMMDEIIKDRVEKRWRNLARVILKEDPLQSRFKAITEHAEKGIIGTGNRRILKKEI